MSGQDTANGADDRGFPPCRDEGPARPVRSPDGGPPWRSSRTRRGGGASGTPGRAPDARSRRTRTPRLDPRFATRPQVYGEVIVAIPLVCGTAAGWSARDAAGASGRATAGSERVTASGLHDPRELGPR